MRIADEKLLGWRNPATGEVIPYTRAKEWPIKVIDRTIAMLKASSVPIRKKP